MDCKKLMESTRIEDKVEEQRVQEAAKLTITFLTKNRLPLTPINYEEWFYVSCKAIEDKHLLSEKNLRVLYKKYRSDLQSELNNEKKEMKEISMNLRDVAQHSSDILQSFSSNIDAHSALIGESLDAIDRQDVAKIEELKVRIQSLEEENKKLREYLEKNRRRLEIVEAKFAKTQREADIDALTKTFNRKRFDRDIQEFENNCQTYSVIFLDIDNFKNINDTYGHAVGDLVLQETGKILTNYVRRNTYVYRYGGEEFVVVLPEGDLNAARVVAERLRGVIENKVIQLDDHRTLQFTASFGATQKREGEHFPQVLQRADEALYEAKRSGKNRVVVKD